MPWFIDVTLVNTETGDLVKKLLDVRIDFEEDAADTLTPRTAEAFKKAIPALIEKAAIITGK